MTGLERLVLQPDLLQNAGRVGLLTHPAGITRSFTPSAVALLKAGIKLKHLYGPEHGVDGSWQAGEVPQATPDQASGLPSHNLYHKSPAEIAERLSLVDTLLVDLQDAGVRFYTFVSTLVQVLEAAKQNGTRVMVLDRPNPLGFHIEGPVLQPDFRSFVGMLELPLRHGFSIGECARWVDPAVEVILCDPLENYGHGDLPWVPPSPNLPNLETAQLYVGTCLVEGSTASEGRGTTLPFQVVGAPALDAQGLAQRLNSLELGPIHFRPTYFRPTFSKHQGQPCAGVQVHVQGKLEATLPIGLAVVGALHEQGIELNPDWLQKLLGIPFDSTDFDPEQTTQRCLEWQTLSRRYALDTLASCWLYPRGSDF